jgi:hypothetical protein
MREDAAQAARRLAKPDAYDRWASLLDGEPAFHNLDVVEHVEG